MSGVNNSAMKYVMVTDFDKHWDKIPGNFTSYSPKMLKQQSRNAQLVSGIETLFIKKVPGTDTVEKAWVGKVNDIEKMPGKIYFRVQIDKEIECPAKYKDYANGWYVEG